MVYKVLIADDEPDALEVMSKHLTTAGYEVITACDGLDALKKITVHDPDVILLDIIMPRMNGFDVLKELRAVKRPKWQPVIIISSKNEFESLRKSYDLEADFYITKPFSLEKVSNAVLTMISLIPLRKAGDFPAEGQS